MHTTAPRLIHLNGPPGSGKSTVAAALAGERPGLLVVEIDELRTGIDGWAANDETKLLARALAVATIETHLAAGHDVIVPQYLGRPEFIRRLADVAADRGAEFREFVLDVSADVAIERFRARRSQLLSDGIGHPEREIADAAIATVVAEAIDRLARLDIAGVQSIRVSAATVDGAVGAIRRAVG